MRSMFFFFKPKTAYEMRISDWSSDVCSSDLYLGRIRGQQEARILDVCSHRLRRTVVHRLDDHAPKTMSIGTFDRREDRQALEMRRRRCVVLTIAAAESWLDANGWSRVLGQRQHRFQQRIARLIAESKRGG